MNQSVSEPDATTPSQPTCPKCGGLAKCYRRDVGGINYEDEYTLECPKCGAVGCKTQYGGAFSSEDATTTCPFCHQGYVAHDAPPVATTIPKET